MGLVTKTQVRAEEVMALKNRPGRHQMCTRTVMDTTDPDITFDEAGVCNWWHEFHQLNERWSNDGREELRESYQKRQEKIVKHLQSHGIKVTNWH